MPMDDSELRVRDRRRTPRFEIAVPVLMGDVRGHTRDLSACGAYIEIERPLHTHTHTVLTLMFQVEGGEPPFLYHCEGEVLRVDTPRASTGGKGGAAIRIDSFESARDEGCSPPSFLL